MNCKKAIRAIQIKTLRVRQQEFQRGASDMSLKLWSLWLKSEWKWMAGTVHLWEQAGIKTITAFIWIHDWIKNSTQSCSYIHLICPFCILALKQNPVLTYIFLHFLWTSQHHLSLQSLMNAKLLPWRRLNKLTGVFCAVLLSWLGAEPDMIPGFSLKKGKRKGDPMKTFGGHRFKVLQVSSSSFWMFKNIQFLEGTCDEKG